MQMHDQIFHFRIVDCALCIRAPRLFRCLVVRKDADDVQRFEGSSKSMTARILDTAAKDQVQFAESLKGVLFHAPAL